MPTYEYECSKCGAVFEAFQRMTERPLRKCRACGAHGTVSRLIGAGAGLIFKGSGFYETDYKRSAAGTEKPDEAAKKTDKAEKSSEKPKEKEKKSNTPSAKSSSKDS